MLSPWTICCQLDSWFPAPALYPTPALLSVPHPCPGSTPTVWWSGLLACSAWHSLLHSWTQPDPPHGWTPLALFLFMEGLNNELTPCEYLVHCFLCLVTTGYYSKLSPAVPIVSTLKLCFPLDVTAAFPH